MLHLLLVRHGETDFNAQRRYQGQMDVPLSDLGVRQAERVAQRLTDHKIDAIFASDLSRAMETARPIAKRCGLKVNPEPRLRELRFGVLESLTFDEAREQYPDMIAAWLDDFNRPPEGAETIDSFNARCTSFLEDLKQNHDEQVALVVAHGGSLSELLRVILGLSREKRWYIELDNASLSEVLIADTFISVKKLNDTCHLSTPEKPESTSPDVG